MQSMSTYFPPMRLHQRSHLISQSVPFYHSLTGSGAGLPLVRMLLLIALLVTMAGVAQAQVSGTVFKDFNASGTKDNSASYNEVGMAGAKVKATKPDGSSLVVTYTGSGTATNGTGGYAVSGGTLGQVRLEFLMPDDYTFASKGASGGTTIQFPTTATQDLAVNYPADYCNPNPELVVPCYVGQALTGPNATEPAMVRFGYFGNMGEIGVSGYTGSPTKVTEHQYIGGTYGVAYNRLTKKVFAGAALHRHVAYGPLGIGGIYEIDPITGTVNNWLNIETLAGIDAGTDTRDASAANSISATKNYDYASFALVGKTSLGDIEISDDGKVLYVINVFQQSLVAIDATTKVLIGSYPITASALGLTCPQADFRPWGLKYHKGKLYVGAVCTAQTSQLDTDLKAYVLEFDPANSGVGFSTYFSFPLNYAREQDVWHPWNENSFDPGSSATDDARNSQAILSNIEFDVDGSMIVALMDRHGLMFSSGNFPPDPTASSTATTSAFVNGDMLRICNTSSGLLLEGGTGCSYNFTYSGGGEFYDDKRQGGSSNSAVKETTGGSLALLPGVDEIASTGIDELAVFENGIGWWKNSNGVRDRAYMIYDKNTPGSQQKTSGLGDIELLCDPAPIEIGNRVWNDTDNDGIQDAGETGISGVSVSLVTGAGALIATAITDAIGNYYFSSGSGTSTNSALYSLTALTANKAYQLKFPTTTGGKSLVTANSGADNIDSDAPASGVVSFTTAGFGANDHTFDVGYGAATCSLTATATPTACNSATNQYSVSGSISLTSTAGGTATITDGAKSTTVTIAASATSVVYSLTGLTSGTGSHTVTVSLAGCGSAVATYSAPASCTVSPCGLALTVTPGLCLSANNTYVLSGSVVATNLPVSGTITITSGAFADRTISVPAGNASGPLSYSGLISNGQTYTVTASFSNTACSPVSQTYTAPASCSVAPVCSLSATATAGLCQTATNTYSASVVVNMTNAVAGTLTVSLPGSAPISQTIIANTSSFTAVFAGLTSDGANHIATISLPGCGTVTANYTAPASCSVAPVCSLTATVTAGLCASATNTYSSTAVVRLSNPTAGILTVTDGPASLTFVTTAVSSATFTAVFNGLISDGTGHTLMASLPGCSTTTTTYTAPASCSVTPICSISATATVGLCQTATNTYSSTVVVTLQNPSSGTITITDGAQTQTFSTTAGAQNTFTVVFPSLASNGAAHTVTATLPGCSTATTGYTAPVSCTVAPTCLLSLTATGANCNATTNLYVLSGAITLSNSPVSQTLTLSDGSYVRSLTANAGATTINFSYTTLQSDGAKHTITVVSSASACGTASTTYTAPASCTVAPVCSVSAVATPGLCASATNTFSNTVLVTLTNPTAGTLTVSDGVRSVTFVVPASVGTVTTTATFNGIASDGSSHTVTVSLPGCSTTTTTYTAPASCTACSLSLTTSVLANGQIGTAYSQTLTVSGGTSPLSYSVSSGSLPGGLSLNASTGVISGTPTAAGSFTTTIVISDAKGCATTATLPVIQIGLGPICSMTLTATPTSCNTATNQYSLSGTITGTNVSGTQSLTITDGLVSTTVSLMGSGSVSYTLTGLASDGSLHLVTLTASSCGTTSTTYTAPASCTYTCPAPVHVCKGTSFAIGLSAPLGQSAYQWYRDGVAIQGATASSYTATQAGSYSLVVNGNVVSQCPDGSCCPVVIVEDSVALYQANAQAPSCNTITSSAANADGRILVNQWQQSISDTAHYYYQVSLGSSFNGSQIVAGGVSTAVPANGLLVANLPNPTTVSGQSYTVRITNGLGCSRDVVVNMTQTVCNCPPAKCLPFVIKRIR